MGEQEHSEESTKTRNPVLVFGTASFLNDAGSDMIAPIWPTFLTNIVGLNVFEVGVVDGLALAITSLSKLGAGYASDRTGKRKAFITLGYILSMIGRIGFLISYGFYQILFWKSADRLGKIRGPPRDAIVAAEAGEKKRGGAFGILRALDTAGAVLGAVITFLLFGYLGYYGIILLAAIPGVGAVIVIAILIKEKRGKDVFKGVTFRGLDKNLKLFFFASILFALGTYSYSFLMLYSSGFGYSEATLPLLYILFTLVYAASSYPFGRASDSVGRKPILLLAFSFLILTSLWVNVVNDPLTVIPLFILFGLMNGALDPVQTSLVSDLVEEERRASIIGAFQLATGLTALPAGIIMGFLWESYEALIAFQFSFIMAAIAIVVLWFVKTKQKNPD
ncbi:MAG: MFS transporter [Candidatus Thorarchaeota archaeon]